MQESGPSLPPSSRPTVKTFLLETTTIVPRSIEETFSFFADAFNLQEITPPWLRFEILTPPPISMAAGALIDYRIRIRGIPVRWRTCITEWSPPYRFVDEQIQGPYRLWRHEHVFTEDAQTGGTCMLDRVTYAIPGWVLAPMINRFYVKNDLDRIFRYRQDTLLSLFPPRTGVPSR